MIPTQDQIKDWAKGDCSRFYECECSRCHYSLGFHSAGQLGCPDVYGNYSLKQIFSPLLTAPNGHWIFMNGGYIESPFAKHFAPGMTAFVHKEQEIKTVKPKIYKHECPCGLIKCDYHTVVQ
jgi:hypothetical protein